MNSRLLTFEIVRDGDAVEIHSDKEGLDALILYLEGLRRSGGHAHLMTESWGGSELSEERQGADNMLLNHVKIILWPQDKETGHDSNADAST